MSKIDLDDCLEELKQVSIPVQRENVGGASLPTVTCTASYINGWDDWGDWGNWGDFGSFSNAPSASALGGGTGTGNIGGNNTDASSVSCSYQDDPRKGVANGDCVRGAIEEAIRDNGGTPNSEEIDKTLEKIAGPKQPGGYSLSSDDFKAAIDEYFDTYKPNNQNELKGLIDEGKDAFARIDTNGDGSRDHAVILTDSDDGGFYYYDPVIGTDNNYIENSGVHDPLVINGSK